MYLFHKKKQPHEFSFLSSRKEFAITTELTEMYAHDLKKTSEDKEYFEVNTELTKTLFDQFLKSDCEVFIYIFISV